MDEHAAFVHIPRSANDPGEEWLWRLEEALGTWLQATGSGELCGVETTAEEWIAFAYGPSADILLRALHQALDRFTLPPGSYLAWRRGGLEVPEEQQLLTSENNGGSATAEPRRRPRSAAMRTLRPRDLVAALALRPPRSRSGGEPRRMSGK